MRVVHVITRMIVGGAMENTLLTCEGLHARGHEVTLVTGPALGPEGELMTRARSGGYRLIVLDGLRRPIRPLRDRRSCAAIRRLLADLRPQIVHTHASKAGILGRQAADSLRRGGQAIRTVHTIHGLPFHPYGRWLSNRLYVWLERRAARQSDLLIGVADAMARQALAAGVGRAEQYVTIYSGMETAPFLAEPPGVAEFRRGLGLGPGDVLVTQVSRLAELKGHEFILAAAQALPPHIHFGFVGDGARRGWIEREVARRGLGGRVHLTGLLPPDRIPVVMHASDVVVHASLREGLARAIPQAMLAARPVVSFDVDGAGEVVDADTGILLPPRDVPGLRLAIETLAESPELRRRLGQAGRARAAGIFDHNHMVDRIEQEYKRLVE